MNEEKEYSINCSKCKHLIEFGFSLYGKTFICPLCGEANICTPIFVEVGPDDGPDLQAELHTLSEGKKLPTALRPSQGLRVFRRYETYIAIGAYGHYIIDPRAEPLSRSNKGVTSHTFVIYFRDAVDSFFTQSYPSSIIPSTLRPNSFILDELRNGNVLIKNKHLNRKLTQAEVNHYKRTLVHYDDSNLIEMGNLTNFNNPLGGELKKPQGEEPKSKEEPKGES